MELKSTGLRAAAYEAREGIPMPNDDHFTYKVTAEDSGGAFVLVEGGLPPRMLITPHVHTREDEISIVIRGRLGVRIGDSEYELGPGGVAIKPRGIPHAMWNPTDEPVLQLEYISPGAYVEFWEEVAKLPAGWRATPAELDPIAARYGQSWLRDEPWLPDVIHRYGLRA